MIERRTMSSDQEVPTATCEWDKSRLFAHAELRCVFQGTNSLISAPAPRFRVYLRPVTQEMWYNPASYWRPNAQRPATVGGGWRVLVLEVMKALFERLGNPVYDLNVNFGTYIEVDVAERRVTVVYAGDAIIPDEARRAELTEPLCEWYSLTFGEHVDFIRRERYVTYEPIVPQWPA